MQGRTVKETVQPSEYVVQPIKGAKPGEFQGWFVPATKAAKAAARRHEEKLAQRPSPAK